MEKQEAQQELNDAIQTIKNENIVKNLVEKAKQ